MKILKNSNKKTNNEKEKNEADNGMDIVEE